MHCRTTQTAHASWPHSKCWQRSTTCTRIAIILATRLPRGEDVVAEACAGSLLLHRLLELGRGIVIRIDKLTCLQDSKVDWAGRTCHIIANRGHLAAGAVQLVALPVIGGARWALLAGYLRTYRRIGLLVTTVRAHDCFVRGAVGLCRRERHARHGATVVTGRRDLLFRDGRAHGDERLVVLPHDHEVVTV